MANEINQIKVGSTTYTLQDSRVDSMVTGVSSVNSKTGDVSLGASDVGALSLDGGTINKSKTVKMDASANSNGANLKWGTVNSKNPYIGYASDQTDGTFVIGSLLGTNYASGLAIGGGSGNLLWKGKKVATTSDIPSVPTVNNGTLTITENGTSKGTFTANQSGNTTIALTNTTYSNATTSVAGLMSAADKTKLDRVSGINEIDLWYDTVTDLTVNEDGINWYDSFEMAGPYGSVLNGTLTMKVPIVAGSNISITKNSNGRVAEVEFTPPPWNVSNAAFGIANYGNGLYEFRIQVDTREGNSASNITNKLSTFAYWENGSYSQSPVCTAKDSRGTITQYYILINTAGGVTLYQASGNIIATPLSTTIYYRKIANA